MLAAPLLYCSNVLFILFGVYSFGTFFHIYNNICPPLQIDIGITAAIWFGSSPIPSQQDVYLSLLMGVGGMSKSTK